MDDAERAVLVVGLDEAVEEGLQLGDRGRLDSAESGMS